MCISIWLSRNISDTFHTLKKRKIHVCSYVRWQIPFFGVLPPKIFVQHDIVCKTTTCMLVRSMFNDAHIPNKKMFVPEFGGVLLFDFASLIHEMAVLFQKVDSLLRMGRNVIILILKQKNKVTELALHSNELEQ